jgi:beta-lactamase superfamily II metal-dependent hydrolase
MNSLKEKPKSSEIEVTVFGNGDGESQLIHTGNNSWIIIDSCYVPRTKRNSALEYLSDIGVDYSTAVKAIVLTHWHLDHSRGMLDLVTSCREATFCMTICMHKKEFFQALQIGGDSVLGKGAAVELKKVMEILSAENRQTILLKMGASVYRHLSGLCLVDALSPSDKEVQLTLSNIGVKITANRTIVLSKANIGSSAMRFKFGKFTAVFGADLECSSDEDRGWNAVHKNSLLENNSVDFLKVPHHGSRNAFSKEFWRLWAKGKAIAVTASRTQSQTPEESVVKELESIFTKAYFLSRGRAPATASNKIPDKYREKFNYIEREGKYGRVTFRSRERRFIPGFMAGLFPIDFTLYSSEGDIL